MCIRDRYELNAAILTETWFVEGHSLRTELDDMEYAENIGMVLRNRGKRGGGVVVAFDKAKISLKEFKIPGNKYEMVCGVGSFSNSNRKVSLIALYIPPKQRVATTKKLKECITDRINKLKTTYEYPIIIIAGDTNNRKLSDLVSDFDDMEVLDCAATRGNAKLDETATNVNQRVTKCDVKPPLCSDSGTASDHNAVLIQMDLPNVHHFTKKKCLIISPLLRTEKRCSLP